MTVRSSELNDLAAEKMSRFDDIFIPYPKHVELHDRLDYLRKLGLRTRGRPQRGLRVLAPTGSGKSTAADAYIRHVNGRVESGSDEVPILKINLEKRSTSKKLMVAILSAFGDPFSTYGNELILKKRVFACFERFNTQLLIVDEVQHLDYRAGTTTDVTDTLKGMLDVGVVPIAFLGTEDAEPLFKRNLQLNGRLLAPCDILPLDARKSADQEAFCRFLSHLEELVVTRDVLPERSHLLREGLVPALFEVSGGRVGRLVRLFFVAVEQAIRRDAVRLEAQDIEWAIDHWAIEQSFITHNPMRRLGGG